jgi:hypothetical protein
VDEKETPQKSLPQHSKHYSNRYAKIKTEEPVKRILYGMLLFSFCAERSAKQRRAGKA